MAVKTGFDRIRDIAKHALADADGDLDEAERAIHKRLGEDPDELALIHEDLRRWAVRDAIEEAARHSREVYWRTPASHPRAETVAGISRAAEKVRAALMDYPLRGGKRLGDATKDDVAAEAKWFLQYGRSNMVRAHWFDMIAKALKRSDDVVKAHLSEKKLLEFQKKAGEQV